MCELDCELEKDTQMYDMLVVNNTNLQSYGNDSVFDSIYNNFTRLDLDDYGNEYENVYETTYQSLYESFSFKYDYKLVYIILICIIIYIFMK